MRAFDWAWSVSRSRGVVPPNWPPRPPGGRRRRRPFEPENLLDRDLERVLVAEVDELRLG